MIYILFIVKDFIVLTREQCEITQQKCTVIAYRASNIC